MTKPLPEEAATDALLPCPFCGREARIGKVSRMRQGICYHCEAAGPLCETEAGAAHAWNTRAMRAATQPTAGVLEKQPDISNSEPRFFIDHGMIHDRVTGKHVDPTPVEYSEGEWDMSPVTETCELLNALATQPTAMPEEEVMRRVRTIVEAFERDEAQGYRSSTRTYVLELLRPLLSTPIPLKPKVDEDAEGGEDPKTWQELAEAAIADLRRYADDELPHRRLVSAELYESIAARLEDGK